MLKHFLNKSVLSWIAETSYLYMMTIIIFMSKYKFKCDIQRNILSSIFYYTVLSTKWKHFSDSTKFSRVFFRILMACKTCDKYWKQEIYLPNCSRFLIQPKDKYKAKARPRYFQFYELLLFKKNKNFGPSGKSFKKLLPLMYYWC